MMCHLWGKHPSTQPCNLLSRFLPGPTHLKVMLIGLLNLFDMGTTTRSYRTTVNSTPKVLANEMDEAAGTDKQQSQGEEDGRGQVTVTSQTTETNNQ